MKKLSDAETASLLKKYRIPTVKQFLVKNEQQASQMAAKLGFPVVMKISSPDIIHKTESKGIILDVKSQEAAAAAFSSLVKNAKKSKKVKVDGVLIQEQVSGREVIVGSKMDPTFGPVIMFGLGGIFVEVLKDVTFRLIPIERKDAREMIKEIKGFPILQGVRGEKPVNFEKLEDFLMGISTLVKRNKKIQELDINPLFVSEKQVLAADVRVLV